MGDGNPHVPHMPSAVRTRWPTSLVRPSRSCPDVSLARLTPDRSPASHQPLQPGPDLLSKAIDWMLRQSQILVPRAIDRPQLQRQQTVFPNEVSREGHPSPASNGLRFQPILDGQSVVVSELGRRRSGNRFPGQAACDGGRTPRRLLGIGCLCFSDSRSGGEVDAVQLGALAGPDAPYSRSTMMFPSKHQCENQTRQVSGQEPDFSKMTNLAGKRPVLAFFNR